MTGYVRNVLAVLTVALALAATSAMVGCGKGGGGGDANSNPKVTKENADKIKIGMSEKEVADILGAHADTNTPPNMPNMKALIYKNGNNLISVAFKDGKVENTQTQFVSVK